MSAPSTAIMAVLEEHREEFHRRVATVEEAVAATASAQLDDDLRGRAERDAHRLAGSLGMFGMARGSEAAAELERALSAPGGPPLTERPHLTELVECLQAELRGVSGTSAGPAATGNGVDSVAAEAHAVLFVTPDPELSDRLAVEALACGMRTRHALTCADARRLVAEDPPDVAVLDVTFAGRDSESLDFLEELADGEPAVPVLVLTASESLVDRVEVARRCGGAFMQRSRPVGDVIEALGDLINRVAPTQGKILAVDDDPAILAAVATLLAPSGLEVVTTDEPFRFWDALTEAAPDLLLMDLDMPGLNGIELCRAVRADNRYGGLPIVFLSANSDPEVIGEAFEAGADDYVGKPIVGQELVTRVRNRLERVRVHRDLAEKDDLTGTATRRRSAKTLEALLALAHARGLPVSLALIDLDNFKSFNDSLGDATGDAALRGLSELVADTFRGEDVVGRWGDDEFVIGAYGMSRDDGVQRVAEMLESFRQECYANPEGRSERVSFSAGVAEYPRDGTDLESLYQAADEALTRSKEKGGDRVFPVGPGTEIETAQPDVVIVDDDDALAGLLVDSLQTRGYRTHRFADGQVAADALSGVSPRIAPSLILLDVDLPGLDGLEVLRQLAKDEVLERTRVIMLTAHAGEADVVEALELGASDHVAKPFSVPILIQRIRRALRR